MVEVACQRPVSLCPMFNKELEENLLNDVFSFYCYERI